MGLIDDLKKFLGGGSGQKIAPFQKNSPTQRDLYNALTQMSGGVALNEFRTNPGVGTGVNAFLGAGGGGMIALPFSKYPSIKSRMHLSLLNKRADADQVLGDMSDTEDLEKVYDMLRSGRQYTGGPTGRGKMYSIDPTTIRPSGKHYPDRRLAVIQDPQTGTMFASPGDFHHGEIVRRAEEMGYPTRVPWRQHEIWAAQEFPGRAVRTEIPKKVNWDLPAKDGLPKDSPWQDTRAATFGRMRLLRSLKKAGYTADTPNPGKSPQEVLRKFGFSSERTGQLLRPPSPERKRPTKFPPFKPAPKPKPPSPKNFGPRDFQ